MLWLLMEPTRDDYLPCWVNRQNRIGHQEWVIS